MVTIPASINLIQHLINVLQPQNSTTQNFAAIIEYLTTHHHQDLVNEMTAPGIVEYQVARQWFESYYITDRNEGHQKAHAIQQEINHAPKSGYYWGLPDFNYGYDENPEHFKPVSNQALIQAIHELMQKLCDPAHRMYT